MPINVNDITDTVTNGQNHKEVYRKIFEDIGHHFLSNAERMSENIADIHFGMKFEIDIPINGVVSVATKIDEYVIRPDIANVIVEKLADSLANKINDVLEEK